MNTEEFVGMIPKDMSQSNDPTDMFIESNVDETDLLTEDGLDDDDDDDDDDDEPVGINDDDELLDNWIDGIVEAPGGTASGKELVNTLVTGGSKVLTQSALTKKVI